MLLLSNWKYICKYWWKIEVHLCWCHHLICSFFASIMHSFETSFMFAIIVWVQRKLVCILLPLLCIILKLVLCLPFCLNKKATSLCFYNYYCTQHTCTMCALLSPFIRQLLRYCHFTFTLLATFSLLLI